MELFGLSAQFRAYRKELLEAAEAVLSSGRYIGGPEVDALERALAAFAGVRRCVTCASGTDALTLMLHAAGVGPGDAVFCPSFTFAATAEAVVLAGARPVFCDVDETLTLSLSSVEEQLFRVRREGRLRPAAVLAVDLFGLPARRDALAALAKRESLSLFADAAQSFGARWKGRGALCGVRASGTSFFPTKPLGACGDGGAVLTDDDSLAETVRSLAWHGAGADKYENIRVGTNSRLDALQAALLLKKLDRLPQELARRKDAAALYDLYLPDWILRPAAVLEAESAFALYTVRFPSRELRDDAQVHLNTLGIPNAIYYKNPLHLQPAYASYADGALPVCELASQLVLSLPMHAFLSEGEIRRVCRALGEITPHDRL